MEDCRPTRPESDVTISLKKTTLGSGPINISASASKSQNISGLDRAEKSGALFKRSTPLRCRDLNVFRCPAGHRAAMSREGFGGFALWTASHALEIEPLFLRVCS